MTVEAFASGSGAQFLIDKGQSPKVMERLTFDDVARVKVASRRPRIRQTALHAVSRPIGSFRVSPEDARRALIRATLRLPRRPVFWAVPASPPVWQHLVYRLDRTHPQRAASGSPPDLMPCFFLWDLQAASRLFLAMPAQSKLDRQLTTGFTRNAVVHGGVLDAGVNFIAKPFTIEQLAAKVDEVVN